MTSDRLIQTLIQDGQVQQLLVKLPKRGHVTAASGLWGSSTVALAAGIWLASNRSICFISAEMEAADASADDFALFSQKSPELFPAWETLPGEGASSGEIEAERMRLCAGLFGRRNSAPSVVVAPIQAIMQPVPTLSALESATRKLAVNTSQDRRELVAWLSDRGYSRLDLVESPGDFAIRGDILDIYPPGDEHPVRVDFFDDRVESIRRFDVSTQRSIESLDDVSLISGTSHISASEGTTIFDYLPDDALIILDDTVEIQEYGQRLYARLNAPKSLMTVEEVLASAGDFGQLHLARFGAAIVPGETTIEFQVNSLARFETNPTAAVGQLIESATNHDIFLYCDNESTRRRMEEIFLEHAGTVPPRVSLGIGLLERGFEWVSTNTIVVGHHELFHRHRQRRRLRRAHSSKPLETWTDLETGDLVVHAAHGIARFDGLKIIKKEGSSKTEEFMTLRFADHGVVQVPVSQIDLVQKYIGVGTVTPKLSKLGGTRWKILKDKVEDSAAEFAESLLRIQAARESEVGTAYPTDTEWQHEFEGAFPFEETEDQLIVNEEIKADLRRERPMDRLLCGDVGYGKTELSMRAAFKVVEYGRQVAVLAPTTVLAEQHYQTFADRMAGFPFNIACLSRFRTSAEQKQIVEAAKKGQVDILIGTHRILSKDVKLNNLGLVIIDEEQRFGVEHKERLKHMRASVDVLTMTATPIPRTLHMSMVGIRDISSLSTPPMDRRSIATQVRPYDRRLIHESLTRELARGGQVFFVHNFVQSIEAMASEVQSIVPDARIVFGHGQMKPAQLEKVMDQFVRHEADILVSTAIIESGIDIPNANTMIINRADRFGLADLHQLRGRVGRSHHRGYCYLLTPANKPIQPKAVKRLKAIEEFSDLGAGFRIAMRDLEIRGAGNILGVEQSGHIAAVGYEMYCQLLEKAVRKLKGEKPTDAPRVHLELGVVAHIPQKYIQSPRARIEIYRRLAACRLHAEVEQLEADLTDAFGRPPAPVYQLIRLAEIRALARRWSIESIILREPDVVFAVKKLADAETAFKDAAGSVRLPDANTIYWRPPSAYLDTETLLTVLKKMLSRRVAAKVPA